MFGLPIGAKKMFKGEEFVVTLSKKEVEDMIEHKAKLIAEDKFTAWKNGSSVGGKHYTKLMNDLLYFKTQVQAYKSIRG